MSTVFDKIEETVTFDEQGNIPRGDNGERVPPATPAENTAATTQPSPDPAAPPAEPAAPVEKKTDVAAPAKETAPGTTPAKPAESPDESKLTTDEEAALKERLSKPEDEGEEWRIRAIREGHKVEKLQRQLTPIAEVMEKIASPDRARRGLEFTAEFADPEVPIADAVSKMTALSESRFQELHDHLYQATVEFYPDQVASDIVGEPATAAELKEGLALLRSGAKTSTQPQSATTTTPTVPLVKPAGIDQADWAAFIENKDAAAAFQAVAKPETLTWESWLDFLLDYPDQVKAIAAEQARAAEAAKPADTKQPELSPAEKQLKEIQDRQRAEFVNKKVDEIAQEGEKIHSEVYAVVDERLREAGLEPDPAKDDERTIKLKERTIKAVKAAIEPEFEGPDGPNKTKEDPNGWMDWSLCSEEQKLNRKLMMKTIDLLSKGDITAARDYVDRLKAQVDLAFQKVFDPELELYNAAMLQSTTQKPRDGSDHKRPELVGGTAPGGAATTKTPWLVPGYAQPGETSMQAMQRWMDENPNASFRAA